MSTWLRIAARLFVVALWEARLIDPYRRTP
jgi:hypothetical protein